MRETAIKTTSQFGTYKGVTFIATSSSSIMFCLLPLLLLPLSRRIDALKKEPTLEMELLAKEPLPLLLIEPASDPDLSC